MPFGKSLFALHQALVLRFDSDAAGTALLLPMLVGETLLAGHEPEAAAAAAAAACRMIGGERLQNLAMSLTDMELQQHPCYLPSLALLLLLNGYAVLANQHKSLPGFDSSSGGSSGSSNGAAPAAAAAPTRGGSSGGGSDGSSSKSGSRSGGGVASAPKPSAASATAGGAAAAAAPAGRSLQGAAPGKKGLRGGFFGSSSSGAKKSSSSLGSAAAPAARDGATASAGSKTPSAAAAAAAAKPKQGRTAAGPAGSTAAASSSSSTPSQSEQWEDAQAARMVQMLYPDLRQKGTYAWQQAHKMLPGLPYSHRQLLQLCELDPEVVLWCGYYRMQAAVPANFLGGKFGSWGVRLGSAVHLVKSMWEGFWLVG